MGEKNNMDNELKLKISVCVLAASLIGSGLCISITHNVQSKELATYETQLTEMQNENTLLESDKNKVIQLLKVKEDEWQEVKASVDVFINYDKTIEQYKREIEQVKKETEYLTKLEVTKPKSNYDQSHVNKLEGDKDRAVIIAGYLPIPMLDKVLNSVGSSTNDSLYNIITDVNNYATGYISEPIIKLNAYVSSLNSKLNELDSIINAKNPTSQQKIENIAKLKNLCKDGSLLDYLKGEEYGKMGYYIDELMLKYPLVVELYSGLLMDSQDKMLYLNDVNANIISLAQADSGQDWTQEQRLTQEDKNRMSADILERYAKMIDDLIDVNATNLKISKESEKITKGFFKWRTSDLYIKDDYTMGKYVTKLVESSKQGNDSAVVYYTSQMNPFLIRLGYDGGNTVYLCNNAYHTSTGTEPLGIDLLQYFIRAQDLGYAYRNGNYKEVYKDKALYPLDMED